MKVIVQLSTNSILGGNKLQYFIVLVSFIKPCTQTLNLPVASFSACQSWTTQLLLSNKGYSRTSQRLHLSHHIRALLDDTKD